MTDKHTPYKAVFQRYGRREEWPFKTESDAAGHLCFTQDYEEGYPLEIRKGGEVVWEMPKGHPMSFPPGTEDVCDRYRTLTGKRHWCRAWEEDDDEG